MASIRVGSSATLIGTLFADGSSVGMTDEQLLDRFASERDAAAVYAFEALVHRHGPMVLAVCRNALRDPNDADDAFQATFLVLALKCARLRVQSRLAPWLHGVALRAARKVNERRGRFERLKQRAEEQARGARSFQPQTNACRREESEVLHEEIGRLPDRYRTPVVLCYLEGLTHEEAARQLGWPVGTVGVHLMRARERLRARLVGRGMAPAITLAAPIDLGIEPVANASAKQIARAAVSFASSTGAATDLIRSEVAGIAHAVLRSMALTKATSVVGALVICGLFAAGTALALASPVPQTRGEQPLSSSPQVKKEVSEPHSILENGGFEIGNVKGPAPDFWNKGRESPESSSSGTAT
jgi:RNA polymerase sigma factor (sigma-70 family)